MGHLMHNGGGHLLHRGSHLQNTDDQGCCCGDDCCLYLFNDLPRGNLIATLGGCALDGEEIELAVNGDGCNFDPDSTCGPDGAYLGQRGGMAGCPFVTVSVCVCCLQPTVPGCAKYLLTVNIADMLSECDATTLTYEASSCSCDPFELVFEDVVITGICGCECANLTVTITEAP